MNKAFIILTIVMSSSLLSQTLIDLYHNDLPQNKDFSKSSVRIVLDQELAFRLNRAPEYINATLQYLHNRYDRNVLDPDSNGHSLLSALDKKSKMLADRWALNQITDLSKQNIPESAISYLTPILNEKRNRQTYSDSILDIYSSLLDSNRTSYLLLKYYLNDSSLVYRPNIDYSEQRYHYELEKISNYEHQYDQLSEKNIFDPRISIVDATKYFPLFANYHTANVFPSSYLSYSSYTSKLLALYDQSFRKSTYFIRTGYFFANKLYDYTAISVFSKDYPVQLSSGSIGDGGLSLQGGIRLFFTDVIKSFCFIDLSLIFNGFTTYSANTFHFSEYNLRGSTQYNSYSHVDYYSTSTDLDVSKARCQFIAINVASPVFFLSNRLSVDLSLLAGLRQVQYDCAASSQMEEIYVNESTNTSILSRTYTYPISTDTYSKNTSLLLLGLDVRYYHPITLFGPQLGASVSIYFGSAISILSTIGIYF